MGLWGGLWLFVFVVCVCVSLCLWCVCVCVCVCVFVLDQGHMHSTERISLECTKTPGTTTQSTESIFWLFVTSQSNLRSTQQNKPPFVTGPPSRDLHARDHQAPRSPHTRTQRGNTTPQRKAQQIKSLLNKSKHEAHKQLVDGWMDGWMDGLYCPKINKLHT